MVGPDTVVILTITVLFLLFLIVNTTEHFKQERVANCITDPDETYIGLEVYGIPSGRYPFYIETADNWYSTQPMKPRVLGTLMGLN